MTTSYTASIAYSGLDPVDRAHRWTVTIIRPDGTPAMSFRSSKAEDCARWAIRQITPAEALPEFREAPERPVGPRGKYVGD